MSEKPKGLPVIQRLNDWLKETHTDRIFTFLFGFMAGFFLFVLIFAATRGNAYEARMEAIHSCMQQEFTQAECMQIIIGNTAR